MKTVNDKASRIYTLVSCLDMSELNSEHLMFLNRYFVAFNLAKRRYARLYKDNRTLIKEGKHRKVIKQQCDPDNILPYRVFRGVEQSIKGLADSQQSNRQNYIANKQEKINQVEQRLEKEKASLIELLKTPNPELHKHRLNHRIPKVKKAIYYLKNRLVKLNDQLDTLEQKQANNAFKVCFGGRKMLKQRQAINPNDKQSLSSWREQWFHRRHNEIVTVGDAGDKCGNSNIQVTKEQGEYFIKIAVPESLRPDYSFSFIKVRLDLGYRQDMLDQHIMSHELKKDTANFIAPRPMTVMLKRNLKGQIKAHLCINNHKPHVITDTCNGTIGVDINADHLAIAETDKHGNIVSHKTIPYDLSGTSGQNEHILSLAVQQVVDKSLSVNKSIIIEDLDFKKKKAQLNAQNKAEHNKKYNKMLSSLSYYKITELFASKTFRFGVELIKVNPAYTSQIGQVKYRDKLNLTVHESAAYVIARRGQGFKEKKPKNVLRIRKELPKVYCRDHPSCNQIVALLDKKLQAKSMSVILSKVFKKPDWKPLLGDELQAHHQSLPTRILDRWSVLPYNRECYLTY